MTTISTNQNPGSYPTEAAAAVKQVMPMRSEFAQRYREAADAAVAAPFKGVTTDGNVAPGLYQVERTGISTAPVVQAAQAFLASLRDDQRAHATFPLDTDWWRRWSNIHPLVMRHGLAVAQMDPAQIGRAHV